ncbi:MAG: alpha/beta hydrolase [Proteobacteria bacterium]|jgi:pimeloyl-ACP methyl ester carboxylesterase|nr:alpha/beta hydrolase [Pseudomonadota bacterium]
MDTPGWFSRATTTPFDEQTIDVAGTPIHYLRWSNDASKPGLIFVHGNGAHAHWWSFIAPFFLDHYQAVAIDLAGAGDSGYCATYTPEAFAAQIAAVAEDAGFGNDTIVVGHSFGGYITMKTGLIYRDQLTGIVLVDSAVRPPDFNWERDPKRSPIKQKRIYPDFESAHARFRLMPPQDCKNQYILDYIGQHSLKQVDGGWTWKFDDTMFRKFDFGGAMHEDLARLKCRVGVIYGEDSYLFSQDIADFMFKVLDESVPFVGIPEAQHHLFLDQPLAFVSALRTLLAEWRHSRPHRDFRGQGT